MKYIVREEHKTGGAIYQTPADAIDAAVTWRLATEVRCEIYVQIDKHPLSGSLSIAHTIEADCRYETFMRLWEEMAQAYPFTVNA